jgi:hypothetical protein
MEHARQHVGEQRAEPMRLENPVLPPHPPSKPVASLTEISGESVSDTPMITSAHFQLAAILLVVLTVIAAELAALALSHQPGSALLWWLNLEVFGSVNALFSRFGAAAFLDYHLTIPALVAVAAIAVVAFFMRLRLALAVMTHAAFAVCALAAASMMPEASRQTASLDWMAAGIDVPRGLLIALLLAGSLAACVTSHADYILGALRARRRRA